MERGISVRGIAMLGDKLLCVRLKPYPGAEPNRYDYWCLPGGGVDEGEFVLDAFEREMIEETGVKPKTGRLLYVHQWVSDSKKKAILELFFLIENPEDYQHVDLSKTTHGAAEIEEIGFVTPETTHILPEFLSTDGLADFIASNEPPRFIYR